MFGAVVEDVLVDFVGNAIAVPAHAKLADKLQFSAGKDFAGRIVRGIQDDGFGVGAERRGKRLVIKRPIGILGRWWLHSHETRRSARENRVGPVVFVERLED